MRTRVLCWSLLILCLNPVESLPVFPADSDALLPPFEAAATLDAGPITSRERRTEEDNEATDVPYAQQRDVEPSMPYTSPHTPSEALDPQSSANVDPSTNQPMKKKSLGKRIRSHLRKTFGIKRRTRSEAPDESDVRDISTPPENEGSQPEPSRKGFRGRLRHIIPRRHGTWSFPVEDTGADSGPFTFYDVMTKLGYKTNLKPRRWQLRLVKQMNEMATAPPAKLEKNKRRFLRVCADRAPMFDGLEYPFFTQEECHMAMDMILAYLKQQELTHV